MKKTIIIASLAGSLILILDSTNAAYNVLMFLIAGIVPGTNILLPPMAMLVGISAMTAIIIFRVFTTLTNMFFNQKTTETAHLAIKSRSPLRRFGNI